MVWWATVTGDTVGIPPEVREPKPSDEATTNRLGQSNALKLVLSNYDMYIDFHNIFIDESTFFQTNVHHWQN